MRDFRESVVQATKSARNSKLAYWLGLLLAVLFFGGLFVRSYYEDYVFEHDTRKLLVYYKHVVPGSISDGDVDNARYLVWKYRNKKEKLWTSLEKKYGVSVREIYEWEDYSDGENSSEETVNLDESDSSEDPAPEEKNRDNDAKSQKEESSTNGESNSEKSKSSSDAEL